LGGNLVASSINIDAYGDALVVLATAGVIVPMVRRWALSPVLGYLGAGALLGPFGLGSFIKSAPILYWFTIVDARNVTGIAELGVVFLLFLIGLQLSYQRLMTMRRLVFGLGGLQIVLTTALIGGLAALNGQERSAAIILGACLALSSTAIVLEVLSNQGRITTGPGRASFAVLLAQDLAVVPILLFIAILGAGSSGSILRNVAIALTQAAAAIAVIIVFGRLLLRPLFRLVAIAQSTELFIAAILFVIVGSGVAAAQAGIPMALGAFVAGLLLAETEYRKAVEAIVEPFKGLLLGIFFFTVGMSIQFSELIREPVSLFASVVGLIALKSLLLTVLGRLFQLSWPAAVETGLLLGPSGEFAFVGIGMATTFGLISNQVSSFMLAVTSLTMALIPPLSVAGRRLATVLAAPQTVEPELTVRPMVAPKQAIVAGHGRVGKVVCALLKRHGVPHIAVDHDAKAVTEDRRSGHEVYYGDASNADFLKACGLMEATGIIITIHMTAMIDDIVEEVRKLRPDILIVSRARDAAHARHLYAVGATDVVPETIEASLQLSEAALVGLGVATGITIASIHEKRDEFRHELQQAARQAGHVETKAIRAKKPRSP
jgi:CPA2 family monovalent cation:H+ antiporter-2